jgi:hypothetical protein
MKLSCFYMAVGFTASSLSLKAQNLAAYSDYKNYFFTFDKGQTKEAEYLPVQSFQVGGNSIAYIANNSSLKAYYQGKIMTLSDGIITKFQASDYLVSFSINQMLSVFDNGKVSPLTSFAESYSTGDSLVAFYDDRNRKFNIYYNSNIAMLEDGMTQAPVQTFKMGDNIFAYVNYLNEFKLFYRGESIKLMTVNRSLPYDAGKNVVAYCNDSYGFSAFYKGTTYDLETFQPKSFAVGDDMIAYVTTNEELNVFYDGKTQLLCSFDPPFYKVADSLIVYNEREKFKVFYRGQSYTLENYIPTDFRVDFNTVAYLDQQGRLKTFCGGKTTLVTNSRIDQFDLYRNVIRYRVYNDNYIYYNSKVYNQ